MCTDDMIGRDTSFRLRVIEKSTHAGSIQKFIYIDVFDLIEFCGRVCRANAEFLAGINGLMGLMRRNSVIPI